MQAANLTIRDAYKWRARVAARMARVAAMSHKWHVKRARLAFREGDYQKQSKHQKQAYRMAREAYNQIDEALELLSSAKELRPVLRIVK